MPEDNVLSIETRVNTAPLDEGMGEAQAVTEQSTSSMGGFFASLAASIRGSVEGIKESLVGMAESTVEATEVMKERFVETAETAKLSGEGMASAFSGLGALAGGGVLLGFMGEFLDETAKTTVELGHLSDQTGINVTSLAGLRQMTKEMGADFGSISTGLIRMNKNLADSNEPSKELVDALHGIGLKVSDLKGLKPEDQLNKISAAMANTRNEGNRVNSAIALLGRGGAALIPVFEKYGGTLGTVAAKEGALTGVTNESLASAERWTRNVALFTAAFQRFGNFAIENMHYVVGAFDGIGAALQTVLELLGAAVVSVVKGLVGLGKLMLDIETLHFGSVVEDAKAIGASFTDTWKGAFRDIGEAWTETASHFKKPPTETEPSAPGTDGDNFHAKTKTKKPHVSTSEGQTGEMELFKQQLQNKKDEQQNWFSWSTANELKYWEEILDCTVQGSKLAADVELEIGKLRRKQATDDEKESEREANRKIELARAGSQERVNLAQAEATRIGQVFGLQSDEYKAAMDKVQQAAQAHAEKMRELDAQVAEGKKSSVLGALDYNLEVARGEEANGDISKQRLLQIERKYENDKFAIESDYAKKQAALEPDPTKRQAILNNIEKLEQSHNAALLKNDQQTVAQKRQMWDDVFGSLSRGFSGTIQGMIQGTQSFSRGMEHMGVNMLLSFADMLSKMLLKWVEHLALKSVLKDTADKADAEKSALKDAKDAAHGGFAAGMHLPFPLNLIMAPTLAAAGFAGVMASAAGGWDMVPNDQIAQIHKNEMVLPAHIANPMRQMIGQGGMGGAHQVSVNPQINIHAMDGASVHRVLSEHGDTIGRITVEHLKKAYKRGAIHV